MSPSLSQIFSFTLHLTLILFLVNSQTEIKPLDPGLLVEFQEGQTPIGETPLPTKKIEPIELPAKKIVAKKVEKPKPLPEKEIVALPIKKKEIKAPVKQEEKTKEVVTALPEKEQPAQAIVTQEDESFAKVVVPEESKPVPEISESKPETEPVAAATIAAGNEGQKEAVATALPAKAEKTQASEEPLVLQEAAPEKAKPSPLVAKESSNAVDAYGAPSGIRDARKLKQYPGNRRPEYPVPDRLNRRQGRVVLLAYVTDQGRVEKIQVEDAKATNLMTREAVQSFSKYRFYKGQKGWVRMPIEFRLVGPSKNMAARLRRSQSK